MGLIAGVRNGAISSRSQPFGGFHLKGYIYISEIDRFVNSLEAYAA